MFACVCVYMSVYVHVCVYVCMCVCLCVHVCVYVCMCVFMCACVCLCVHAYVCVCLCVHVCCVSSCVTGDSNRNVLVESARIARGKISPLSTLTAAGYGALVFPGGFGAAKNLCVCGGWVGEGEGGGGEREGSGRLKERCFDYTFGGVVFTGALLQWMGPR